MALDISSPTCPLGPCCLAGVAGPRPRAARRNRKKHTVILVRIKVCEELDTNSMWSSWYGTVGTGLQGESPPPRAVRPDNVSADAAAGVRYRLCAAETGR